MPLRDVERAECVPLRDFDFNEIGEKFSFLFGTIQSMEEYRYYLHTVYFLFENLPMAMFMTSVDNVILWANDVAANAVGYEPAELVGNSMGMLRSGLHSEDFYETMEVCLQHKSVWNGEVWQRKKDGKLVLQWMWQLGVFDWNGNFLYKVIFSTDLSHNTELLELVNEKLYTDFLTGLPSRNRLQVDAEYLWNKKLTSADYNNYLVIVDINEFELFNMHHGFQAGDQLLIQLKNKLSELQQDFYKGSSSQFIALIKNKDYSEFKRILESIQKSLSVPFEIEGVKNSPTFNIGITTFDDEPTKFETLIHQAELVVQEAKQDQEGRPHYYSENFEERITRWFRLRDQIHSADVFDQLELYYQPYVNSNKELLGSEALLRWNRPNADPISPYEFIQIIEKSGFIKRVGYWIIEEAFKTIVSVREYCNDCMFRSINLSIKQFEDENFVDNVIAINEKYAIDPQMVTFEITETQAVENMELLRNALKRLREYGYRIALDDFGTGYASFGILNELDFDYIKIDRHLITGAAQNARQKVMVTSLVSMIKNLRMKVVAEGVEKQEEWDLAKELEVDIIQGYFINKPLSVADFIKIYT